MYIGPSIPSLGLKGRTLVNSSEMLPQLVSLIETHPMIRSLYVPTSKLAIAMQNREIKGSLENQAMMLMLKLAKQQKQQQNTVRT